MQSKEEEDVVHSIYVDCKFVLFNALNLIYLQLIQSNDFVPDIRPHSVSTTLQDVIDLVMWNERSREIWIDVKDRTQEGYILSFDQRSLRVVLFNVISNALKFQEKGRIFIKIGVPISAHLMESAQTMLEITVVDQGIGVLDSEVAQVFDLFW